MLKRKEIAQPTGASLLAERMAEYTNGMDVHELPLSLLDDAPAPWNFYRPLPPDKFAEMVQSVEERGLLSPILVWEREDGRYMILSGHNRKRALQRLYETTGEEKYQKAHCVVKRAGELTPEQAQETLIDCNWVQRTLSPAEKARSIYHKYVSLGRQKRGAGRRGYDAVAEHFGLKATQVYQYTRLAELEEEWLSQLDAGELTVKAASRLADFTPEQRAALYEMDASSADIMRLSPLTPAQELRASRDALDRGLVELSFTVPRDKIDAVRAAVEAALK